MSKVKFDHCTGLACGDECDGKNHATTERTCETCGNCGCMDPRQQIPNEVCGLWRPPSDEPRPSAQDADEFGVGMEVKQTIGSIPSIVFTHTEKQVVDGYEKVFSDWWKETVGTNGGWTSLERSAAHDAGLYFWNCRPSLPMSAEVEKAIETGERLIIEATLLWHGNNSESLQRHIEDFRIAVATLKEKV